MNGIWLVTILESLYLLYMFFVYKTNYSYASLFEPQVVDIVFVHDTGVYENKVCLFGKAMAILAIGLAFVRAYFQTPATLWTILFDGVCILLATLMNTNALLYILPLVLGEAYILSLENPKEE